MEEMGKSGRENKRVAICGKDSAGQMGNTLLATDLAVAGEVLRAAIEPLKYSRIK